MIISVMKIDDYGDENDQKQTNTMPFKSKYTPFRHNYFFVEVVPKFWSTTSPTSLLLAGITWQAPPLHQESNMSTRCLKPPPQPPPPLAYPAFTRTVSGPPPL